MKIFLSGSRKIEDLGPRLTERLDNIMAKGFDVLIGDAVGADRAIQIFLSNSGYRKVTVFCSGDRPRQNVGLWPAFKVNTKHPYGSLAFHTAKDEFMATEADIGLAVWDGGSSGTLNNMLNLLRGGKVAVVYYSDKEFKNVKTVEDLEELVSMMGTYYRTMAEKKIKLSEAIENLKSLQQVDGINQN